MIRVVDQVKLRAIKAAINGATKVLIRLLPKRSTTLPTAKIIEEVFESMEAAALKEMKRNGGVNAYADGNFMRFLQVVKGTTVLLMEDDPVYRRWAEHGMFRLAAKVRANQKECA